MNNRILVIDDTEGIHTDIRKILIKQESADLADLESSLFGDSESAQPATSVQAFEIDSAYQGQDGFEMVKAAFHAGKPYAMAFVDMRMPPGWDGLKTIQRCFEADPLLQVVICTAYSDYTWQEICASISHSDRLLILKKPFDTMEVQQIASALTAKWNLSAQVRGQIRGLEKSIKSSTEQLVGTRAHLAQIVESIPSFLIAMDADYQITQWNHAAREIFGLHGHEALGKSIWQLPVEWDLNEVRALLDGVGGVERPSVSEVIVVESQGGKSLTLNVSAAAIADHGMLMVGEDISHDIILEQQLRQSQKLEAIGQLAAGIAHEINTPSQYISDNTVFLKDSFVTLTTLLQSCSKLPSAAEHGELQELTARITTFAKENDLGFLLEEIPTAIDESIAGLQRISKIVGAMKEFSHPGSEEKQPADLNQAILGTITVASNEWKYVAEVETDFDEHLPQIPCFIADLNQVILNMIVNASHAIQDIVGNSGEKGTIRIETRKTGNEAELRIGDTGSGIAPENLQRVFEPFFTTKEVGKGTGQGLALAFSTIVDKHGGSISVESEPGKGTTFIMRLPLAEGITEDELPAPPIEVVKS